MPFATNINTRPSCSRHHEHQTHLQMQAGRQRRGAFQQPARPARDAGAGTGGTGQQSGHCWGHGCPPHCAQGGQRGHCQRTDLPQVLRTPEKTMHCSPSVLGKPEPLLPASALQRSSSSVAEASLITCSRTRASPAVSRNQQHCGKEHKAAGTSL